MKKRTKIGLAVTIVLVVLTAGGYLWLLSTQPMYEGELHLSGLDADVEVLFDDFGVPHIQASTEEDAYFALGYVHAQDRLFQMEMLRRAASGRLAEILGPDLLEVDVLFRTLGIGAFAQRHAQQLLAADTAAWQKSALAYQRGINEFIKHGKTPLEFLLIGIPKTEFTPADIFHAIGFMSFGFAEGLRADPVLEQIRTQWGEAYLRDFALTTPADAERIPSYNGPRHNPAPLVASIDRALRKLPVPLWQGSNGWAISGSKTASGFPLLANDTHMGFAQPAVWYEAHLQYPGFDFYGHHVAGIPFALLGNNRRCAWGLTMFENDDTDFYRETLRNNGTEVQYKGAWTPVAMRDEVIAVKGKRDTVMKVITTPHGPLVNGILEGIDQKMPPVALWWMLHQDTNHALEAAYRMNHAGSLADMEKAGALFSAPGLNVMYADADGNIGWWAVAKLPIRPAHVQPKLFLDGATGADEPLGFYPFSKNPHAINPPWGFVYSANNQPDTVDGILYPGYYYPKARASRIVELLRQDKKWTIDEVKKVNLDVVSLTHPETGRIMAEVLRGLGQPAYEPLIEVLLTWNGDHQVSDIGPPVYYQMLSQIMHEAVEDELGTTAYESIMATSVPKNSYHMLLGNEQSPWWDDVRTKDVRETRAQIFDRAAQKTLQQLKKIGGNSVDDWTWGKFHQLTHRHPLAAVKPLDMIFNVGPFPVPGGSEVINNLHFDLDTTGYFSVTGGPSLRKITDFGSVDQGETVGPTGQSGVWMSPHYDDQAAMYANGQFRKMWMNRADFESRAKRLLLRPKK
jgi:penicillin amidase